MQHIKDLLSKRVKQTGLAKNIKDSLVSEECVLVLRDEFGASVCQKIKPLYLKNKILVLACLSSAVSQEINLRKGIILSQINKKFKSKVVDDIKFIL
jgi:hypothetical protein